jgi:signal transduction histidine kinase
LLGLDAASVHPSEEALLSVMSPKDRRAAGKLLAAALSGDLENFQAEYRISPPGGGVRWLAMFGRLVRGSRDRPARVTGIGIDITGQKRVEELLRKSRETLEQRVKERTADLLAANTKLEKEMANRQRLEGQMLEVSEREQRRIGRDLHDGLGQQISGITFHAHLLQKRLAEKGLEDAAAAERIVALLDEAKIQARRIARGLQPVGPESNGLMAGLGHFAATASELYRIRCTFVCPEPVLVEDHAIAVHLFRIAQESVANAFRHGEASAIEVSLRNSRDRIELEISDDGKGLPKRPRRKSGLGLRFMEYRAEAVGGMLKVLPGVSGGAVIRCSVPVANGKA